MRVRGGRSRDEGTIVRDLTCRREKCNISSAHGIESNEDVSCETAVIYDIEIGRNVRLKRRKRHLEKYLATRRDDTSRNSTYIDVRWRGRNVSP